jgi:hypothetical protein
MHGQRNIKKIYMCINIPHTLRRTGDVNFSHFHTVIYNSKLFVLKYAGLNKTQTSLSSRPMVRMCNLLSSSFAVKRVGMRLKLKINVLSSDLPCK